MENAMHQEDLRTFVAMENAMHQEEDGSGSVGDGMSIFGQSIDVRRPVKSRRRVAQRNLSPAMDQAGMDRLHERKAMAENGQGRAEPDLSRATSMAKKLERLIEQTEAKARSHRPELQGARATSSRRKKKGHVVEAPPSSNTEESSTLYMEVMQELHRVKRELRKLQHEVKVAREAKAERDEDASMVSSIFSFGAGGVGKGDADEAHPDVPVHEVEPAAEAIAERASETPGFITRSSCSLAADRVEKGDGDEAHDVLAGEMAEDTRWTEIIKGLQREASRTSVSTDRETWLTATSSDEGLRHGKNDDSSEEASAARREEHDDNPSLQAAEAELNSARADLESIREEGLQFTAAMERTRRETARVADELGRLEEQEKKARAQVQQLSAKLHKARSRLAAVTVADEMAAEILSSLKAALRQLDAETEAAEKEKALTELESRCVGDDLESIDAEIAGTERRIRESVGELEPARASEVAATERLRALVESARAVAMSQRSGNVTISRFEYEYLAGRAEVVRTLADKKVAAAEAWVEARQAGEKEMVMRAEAIERQLGEDFEKEEDDGAPAATSRRKKTSSSMVRNPRTASLSIKNRGRVLIPSFLKLMASRCTRRD